MSGRAPKGRARSEGERRRGLTEWCGVCEARLRGSWKDDLRRFRKSRGRGRVKERKEREGGARATEGARPQALLTHAHEIDPDASLAMSTTASHLSGSHLKA